MKTAMAAIAALLVVLTVTACQPAPESGAPTAPTEEAMAMGQDHDEGMTTDSGASDDEAADDHDDEADHDEDEGADHGHDETYTFGEPGDPSESDRVIVIKTSDSFAFDPDTVEVAVGETVTFRVVNDGTIEHEFTLGDAELQEEHEAMMQGQGGHMMDEPNAIRLEPGQSKDLVWHFTTPGEVLYGCHTPGHYASGMVGQITVK